MFQYLVNVLHHFQYQVKTTLYNLFLNCDMNIILYLYYKVWLLLSIHFWLANYYPVPFSSFLIYHS